MIATNPFSLSGKTILITGAAGGIGSETARVCAALGADLILADRDNPQGLVQALVSDGVACQGVGFDVTNRQVTEQVLTDLGDDVFDTVININLKGTIHLARAALPAMMRRGSGKLVLVGSVAGRNGGLKASPHYVAAKGGVNALVKWLAHKSAAYGVTVNGVCPGATQTPMTDGQAFNVDAIAMGRLAQTSDIAKPIAFLLGSGSDYMTGATIDVNGGVYMS
jgi:3-oxoacyl-[acyl-carrier protein] reductase